MRKTYGEIQRELLNKTKSTDNLKERIKTLKSEVKRYKDIEKGLIIQYERIINEWRKRYDNLISHGWKIVFVKIINWYRKISGKKVI